MEARTTSAFAARTVGEIVSEDYRLGSVFKRFGIDFCCGGGRTVADACNKEGVAVDELEEALQHLPRASEVQGALDAREWPLDFLADYITNVHHSYVRKTLPILVSFSAKVAKVHGGSNPELLKIASLIKSLTEELTSHLKDEETILFPYVKRLVVAQTQGVAPSRPEFGSAEHPISAMEQEHEGAATLMRTMRALSNNFQPPPHACNTYKALFATLEEFEEDLHRHVHLENNVFFPRAIELEGSTPPLSR